MKLSDVVTILPGRPFRSRLESEADGGYLVIQPRDLAGGGCVRLESAARLRTLPGSPRGFLQTGDVVFQPRGTRYPVAKVEHIEAPAVAAAPLFILRGEAARIVPDFLVALIRSRATQATLRQAAVGTHVPQVPRQAIESLHVELPDLPSQIRLADLAQLEWRETELLDRLRDARERLFDLAIGEVSKRSQRRANADGPKPSLAGAPAP